MSGEITKEQATVDYNLLLTLPDEPVSWHSSVKPVLENRCIVCHGCYDAHCQLKLSSYEGIKRGASKVKVYDGSRIKGIEPTRLMIDAKTTEEWRSKGFHAVLNEGQANPQQNLDQSVLYQLLRLKQLHPQARVVMLSDDFDLALDREQVCPERDEFQDYATEHPLWGMPYAMPNLRDEDYSTLVQWLAQGSPVEPVSAPTKQASLQIVQWEQFFNGSSNKALASPRSSRSPGTTARKGGNASADPSYSSSPAYSVSARWDFHCWTLVNRPRPQRMKSACRRRGVRLPTNVRRWRYFPLRTAALVAERTRHFSPRAFTKISLHESRRSRRSRSISRPRRWAMGLPRSRPIN